MEGEGEGAEERYKELAVGMKREWIFLFKYCLNNSLPECEDFLDVGLGSVWASGSDSELVPPRRNSVHSVLVSQVLAGRPWVLLSPPAFPRGMDSVLMLQALVGSALRCALAFAASFL